MSEVYRHTDEEGYRLAIVRTDDGYRAYAATPSNSARVVVDLPDVDARCLVEALAAGLGLTVSEASPEPVTAMRKVAAALVEDADLEPSELALVNLLRAGADAAEHPDQPRSGVDRRLVEAIATFGQTIYTEWQNDVAAEAEEDRTPS